MDRKAFLSLNVLTFLKTPFVKADQTPVYKRVNSTMYESIDVYTGEHTTFSLAETFIDGTPMTSSKCDGCIYLKIEGSYYKRNYTGPLNVKWFGAKGDGISDDTKAIQAAIQVLPASKYQSGGGAVYLPEGRYKISSGLVISRSQVKFKGAGLDLTFIEPTGTFKVALTVKGYSFSDWLNAIEIGDFTIYGRNFSGTGMHIENVGLRSVFENINIFDCGKNGIYCKSLFDHIYRNIEVRNCKDIGIHIYEQNKRTNPALKFEENSFLSFDNVRPIGNNRHGIQWLIQGGDSFRLMNCKPSEGTVGLRIESLANRFELSGLYIDGYGPNSTGIQIDDPFTRSICIQNLSVYNVKYGVEVIDGKGITVEHVQVEKSVQNLGQAVYVHRTCSGYVTYNGFEDPYSKHYIDETKGKLSVPLRFVGNMAPDGKSTMPLVAKIQTLTVNLVMPASSTHSEIFNVPAPTDFKEVYFVSANITDIKLIMRNFDLDSEVNLIAYASSDVSSNIQVGLKLVGPGKLRREITVPIQVLIVGATEN